jgi:hypothetical protein
LREGSRDWGSDRPKFGRPEEIYRDKELCVTGKITIYLGIPELWLLRRTRYKCRNSWTPRERNGRASDTRLTTSVVQRFDGDAADC